MSTVSVKGYDRRKPEKKPDPFQSIIDGARDRQRKSRVWIPESEIRDQHSMIGRLMRKLGITR